MNLTATCHLAQGVGLKNWRASCYSVQRTSRAPLRYNLLWQHHEEIAAFNPAAVLLGLPTPEAVEALAVLAHLKAVLVDYVAVYRQRYLLEFVVALPFHCIVELVVAGRLHHLNLLVCRRLQLQRNPLLLAHDRLLTLGHAVHLHGQQPLVSHPSTLNTAVEAHYPSVLVAACHYLPLKLLVTPMGHLRLSSVYLPTILRPLP
ncbi:hypothetical protein PISMIDRAFT_529561 [Pisolithus microcarpus 441]|uniref:Uncharacterized protein n=1 Tax=Pisolithus microcarpus 441 TaxID=765257 RepID=A0A0C9YBD9_9AGAM|nr:hypothetical protein PISMIDRAFT_529561 [Pisolithus microcarpus 441]